VTDLSIPGFGDLRLRHLVLDYNGTLALDGELLPGALDALATLQPAWEIHVVTGDTHGSARRTLAGAPFQLTILPQEGQAVAKLAYVENLGTASCVAVGNGRNDRLMLRSAAIGICLLQQEGASGEALFAADIVCRDILDALAMLGKPQRLIATLRS
jgi:soluble P-type ATPase